MISVKELSIAIFNKLKINSLNISALISNVMTIDGCNAHKQRPLEVLGHLLHMWKWPGVENKVAPDDSTHQGSRPTSPPGHSPTGADTGHSWVPLWSQPCRSQNREGAGLFHCSLWEGHSAVTASEPQPAVSSSSLTLGHLTSELWPLCPVTYTGRLEFPKIPLCPSSHFLDLPGSINGTYSVAHEAFAGFSSWPEIYLSHLNMATASNGASPRRLLLLSHWYFKLGVLRFPFKNVFGIISFLLKGLQ